MLYNRILLPVDGSEHSMRAVVQAVRLARQGGEVTVLTVVPVISSVIGGHARKEVEEDVVNNAKLITQPVLDIFKKENITAHENILFNGAPADGIIKVADMEKSDIIVMGCRGRSEIEGLLLGSVTHKVLTVANQPVLVVR